MVYIQRWAERLSCVLRMGHRLIHLFSGCMDTEPPNKSLQAIAASLPVQIGPGDPLLRGFVECLTRRLRLSFGRSPHFADEDR